MQEAFKFKNFSISQEHCAMKVGTDGVLLGAWADGGKRILDIGSGTGLIALMMAQRFQQAEVEGVEIDKEASVQSRENVSSSPFKDRIKIIQTALQSFVPEGIYDSIVTNPPFFVNSLSSPDKTRTVARHANTLSFSDIFAFASVYLEDDGEVSAVIPMNLKDEFSAEAFVRGFCLIRQTDIKTVERKPAKRCLLAFSKQRRTSFEKETVTLMTPDGKRSDWYYELTKDFYIK